MLFTVTVVSTKFHSSQLRATTTHLTKELLRLWAQINNTHHYLPWNRQTLLETSFTNINPLKWNSQFVEISRASRWINFRPSKLCLKVVMVFKELAAFAWGILLGLVAQLAVTVLEVTSATTIETLRTCRDTNSYRNILQPSSNTWAKWTKTMDS